MPPVVVIRCTFPGCGTVFEGAYYDRCPHSKAHADLYIKGSAANYPNARVP